MLPDQCIIGLCVVTPSKALGFRLVKIIFHCFIPVHLGEAFLCLKINVNQSFTISERYIQCRNE